MSRTYKDIPRWVHHPEDKWDYKYEWAGHCYIAKPGVLKKKKKRVDTKWHWMSTPSAWTRTMMNRPMRAKVRAWENKTAKLVDIEEHEASPDQGNGYYQSKKPHIYYW